MKLYLIGRGMNSLKEYLSSNGEGELPSINYLESIVKDYPWFTMGHKLLARASGRITHQVALMLYTQRCPSFFSKEIPPIKVVDYTTKSSAYKPTPVNNVSEIICAVETVSSTRPQYVERKGNTLDVATVKIVGAIVEDRSESAIIDKFLTVGEYRIVPKDNVPEIVDRYEIAVIHSADEYITPKLIKSQSSIVFIPEEDDEFLTEELAEIYTNQELYKQSMKIYSRLMLIYPEKSVYFAEILNGLQKSVEKNN